VDESNYSVLELMVGDSTVVFFGGTSDTSLKYLDVFLFVVGENT
jgi:hypothetical protein